MKSNYNKFDIIMVCNGYSKYLDACLYFWDKMDYPKDCYRIFIVSSIKDVATYDVIQNYAKKNFILVPYIHDDFHNKGKLLKEAYKMSKHQHGNIMVMTDADMIFDINLLNQLNINYQFKNNVVSSYREHIATQDMDLFFEYYRKENINWTWDNLKRQVLWPSPFMGWLLCFPYEYAGKLDFINNHCGYDEIDWKIYGQLKSMSDTELLYFDNPPLHLYHGEKGQNWKGVTI